MDSICTRTTATSSTSSHRCQGWRRLSATPLEAADFVWPSEDEIRAAQLKLRANDSMEPSQPPLCWSKDRRIFLPEDERVRIPDGAAELLLGLCVVAHAGTSGHSGAKSAAKALEDLLSWLPLRKDVVSQFMHYMATASRKAPWSLGEML
ncbi:unnamed protein product [Phytophthora fragariaefolia]|uniref:Unnamed protein product n=1 Tax=Phytophthora fragariaefolia TaxID=1490495 RepID=A0A9W7D4U0_9STRA|nr:unnamed protein product [Phytophthora fragariaefolia]